MRSFSAAALAVLMACHALAQDDPVETRSYAVGFLMTPMYARHGTSLSLAQDEIGAQVRAGEEASGIILTHEELAEILKRDVAPKARLERREWTLLATDRRSVLDAIAAWLDRARVRHGRKISIDAAILLVPHERWGLVEPKDLPGVSKTLQSFRLSATPGLPVVGQRIRQLSYVRDHDVQIGTGACALDPIVDVLSTGAKIDVLPRIDPVGDEVVFEVRAETSAFEGMDERNLKLLRQEAVTQAVNEAANPPGVASKPWEALVQLPKITLDMVRGQVRARAGETVVAASASRADGVWVLVLTPTVVGPGPAAPEPGTRVYDVGALLAPIQDFAGPRPWLVSPTAGGAGPLTGATFTLDEPRVGYGEERLKDDLRAVVDPPNTPGEKSAVGDTYGGGVTIRANHAAAEKVMKEAFRRETRTVRTEAAILAFKAGAKDVWAKTLPVLAPGGSRATPAALAPLFDEARKGGEVRFAGTISVGGRLDQSVYAFSGRQRAYVQDFEPQVSTYTSQGDPIIGVFVSGLGLQVRPTPIADGGWMSLDLHCWSQKGEVVDDKAVSTGLGPVQRASAEGPRWAVDVVCAPGEWTLAGLENSEGEDWALFVRVLTK